MRMIRTMYDALLGFSGVIPRLITALGLIFAAIGFFAAIYFVINALLSRPAEGWSSIMVALTFFFGVTFLILGTIGEYLQKIYNEGARRPLYFVSADTSSPSPDSVESKRLEGRRTWPAPRSRPTGRAHRRGPRSPPIRHRQ